MAQKIHLVLIDDVDGSTADETVTFALDGVTYEIDLNAANAAKLRDSLATWVGSARRIAGRSTRGRRPKAPGASTDTTAIREWARANGYTVNERGRVPAEVKAAYEAAH